MRVLALFLLFAATSILAQEHVSDSICYDNNCYINGLRYDFTIREAKYRQLFRWSPFDGSPAPVSPKRAYELAKKRLAAIQIPKDFHWDLDRISLEPLNGVDGKWMYVVSFSYWPDGAYSGPRWTMDFVVTMDDELIEPVITAASSGP